MFEDDNLDDLDIGLEDLPSSRMGRSPFAFPFQGSPSPTAPSSPGARASRTDWLSESSSMQDGKAGELGQEEDFGECCSRLSLQVFGVVSRFGVV